MRIGVGICNFNRRRLLAPVVSAVLSQGSDVSRVLVVDNASTDGSIDALSTIADGRLRILKLDENRGGAGGFRAASCALLEEPGLEALALVDSDCFLARGCLSTLAERLIESAGVVGPKVLYAERRNVIQEVGGEVDWNRASLVHRYRGHDEASDQAVTAFEEVDFVSSCALLARREVFESVGHFRSEYFIYFDDVEWCLRAGAAGFKVQAAGEARALHHGGSLRKQSNLPTYYAWRNRVHCFLEHAPDRDAMREVLLGEVAQAVATCRVFSQRRCAEVIYRATRDGLEGLTGRCRLSQDELRLDSPGACAPSPPPGRPLHFVDHLFESEIPKADAGIVIQDRFGKSGTLPWIESVRSQYEAQKCRVICELTGVRFGKRRVPASDRSITDGNTSTDAERS